jgi:transposase
VVHPAAIEVQVNDRVKTDKRDSLKIATQLSQGRLQGIHVPSTETESLRSVSRLRASLIKQKTRSMNRIKGYLHFLGIKVEFTRISKKTLSRLRELDLLSDNKFCFRLMLSNLERINEEIRECEERLKQQSDKDPLESFYLSVPGVGAVIARVLSNELGDMSQFSNEKKLFSYCGLTPSEYSSGEKVYRGRITRQGKSMLRMYLTQAAWRAIRKDESLEEIFKRIAVRAGTKKAIQAVARKLIGRIRSCLLKKEAYELKRKQKD